jgi:hypothetical protein
MKHDLRHQRGGFGQHRGAAIPDCIQPAPAVVWLIDRDPMTAAGKLPRDAANEMGVAIVPAGNEGLIE